MEELRDCQKKYETTLIQETEHLSKKMENMSLQMSKLEKENDSLVKDIDFDKKEYGIMKKG